MLLIMHNSISNKALPLRHFRALILKGAVTLKTIFDTEYSNLTLPLPNKVFFNGLK